MNESTNRQTPDILALELFRVKNVSNHYEYAKSDYQNMRRAIIDAESTKLICNEQYLSDHRNMRRVIIDAESTKLI